MVVVPKPYKQAQAEYAAECVRLGEMATRMYYENVMRHLYIVGRKQAGLDTLNPRSAIWAELSIAEESPEGWTVVCGEHIPRNYPFSEYPSWIRERLNREPLWIFAD